MTATQAKRRPPSDLGAAGKALFRQLTGMTATTKTGGTARLELNASELLILAMAARQADDIALMEKAIAADGAMVDGAAGQRRLNQALVEVRQGRLALARLIAALAIPDVDHEQRSPASRHGQKAARARWDRVPKLADHG
jgi:hypothetical protein